MSRIRVLDKCLRMFDNRLHSKFKGLHDFESAKSFNGAMAFNNFSGFRDFRQWRGSRDVVFRMAFASGGSAGDLSDDLADPNSRKAV